MNKIDGSYNSYQAQITTEKGFFKNKRVLSLNVDGIESKLTLYPMNASETRKHAWKKIAVGETLYKVKSDKLNKEIVLPENCERITTDAIHEALKNKANLTEKLKRLPLSQGEISKAVDYLLRHPLEFPYGRTVRTITIPNTHVFVIMKQSNFFMGCNGQAISNKDGRLYDYFIPANDVASAAERNTEVEYPKKYSGANPPKIYQFITDYGGDVFLTLHIEPLSDSFTLTINSWESKPKLSPPMMNALMNTLLTSLCLMHRDGISHNQISEQCIFSYNQQLYVGRFGMALPNGDYSKDLRDTARLLFLQLNENPPDAGSYDMEEMNELPNNIWNKIDKSSFETAKEIILTRKRETLAICKKNMLSGKEYAIAYNLILHILENKGISADQLRQYKTMLDQSSDGETQRSVVEEIISFVQSFFPA